MMYPRESNPSKVSQSKLCSAPCVASGRCLPWVASLAGQGLLSSLLTAPITLGEWGPGHVAATSANTSLTSQSLVTKLRGVCVENQKEMGFEILKLFADNF